MCTVLEICSQIVGSVSKVKFYGIRIINAKFQAVVNLKLHVKSYCSLLECNEM